MKHGPGASWAVAGATRTSKSFCSGDSETFHRLCPQDLVTTAMKLIASAFHTSIQRTIRTSSPIQVIQGITHISRLIMDLHLIRVHAIHTSGTAAWLQSGIFRPVFCKVAFGFNESDSERCWRRTHLPQVFRHKRWKIEMLCKQRSDRKPCKISHRVFLPRFAFSLRDRKNRSVQRKSELRKASTFVLKKVHARGPTYIFRFGRACSTGPEDTLGRNAWKRLPAKGLVGRDVARETEEIAHLPLNCRFDAADFEIVWINHLMRASKDGPLEEQDITHKSTSCTCRH